MCGRQYEAIGILSVLYEIHVYAAARRTKGTRHAGVDYNKRISVDIDVVLV